MEVKATNRETLKLAFHARASASSTLDDVLFSPKDLPGVRVGDVLKIYHAGNHVPWLLIQVTDSVHAIWHTPCIFPNICSLVTFII